YARSRCFDEQGRIDRRLKQRQGAFDAVDVHAVTDLEQPIGDRIPILVQPLVARDLEEEALQRQTLNRRDAHVLRVQLRLFDVLAIADDAALHLDDRVGELLDTAALKLAVGQPRLLHQWLGTLRACPQETTPWQY